MRIVPSAAAERAGGPVGPEVVLQAPQERVGAGPAGVVHVGDSGTGEVRA